MFTLSLSLSEVISGEAAEYTCSLQDLKVGYNRLVVKEHEFHNFIKTALVYATPTALSDLVICALSLSLSLSLYFSIQSVDATSNGLLSIPPPYMWRSRGLKHLLLGNNKISSVSKMILIDVDLIVLIA